MQVAFKDIGDLFYCTRKQDANVEYFERIRQAIYSNMGSINFADPANIRQVLGILMNEVRDKSIYISNKYKIQKEPLQLKWDKFLPTLEKDFLDILKEVLSCKNNQQQPISDINNSMPNEKRSLYNTVIANKMRTLTSVSNTNGAWGYECILHRTSKNNTYSGNYNALHHTYQGWQNNRHNFHTASFQSLHTN